MRVPAGSSKALPAFTRFTHPVDNSVALFEPLPTRPV